MYVCMYECLYVSNRLGVGETERLPPCSSVLIWGKRTSPIVKGPTPPLPVFATPADDRLPHNTSAKDTLGFRRTDVHRDRVLPTTGTLAGSCPPLLSLGPLLN